MKNLMLLMILIGLNGALKAQFEKDLFKTSKGDLSITFIGHGTLLMEFEGKVIHIDPVGQYADYGKLPKADLVLVTHHHGDHLDVPAIEKIRKPGMTVVLTAPCKLKFQEGVVLNNGDSGDFAGIHIEAVPAYNIKHERVPGFPYHPKGEGNGYILRLGNLSVYVAGDSENTPEMKALKGIDIAFLPMNLPYTMTPEMVVDAVRSFKPKVLYPYHFGNTDTGRLIELMKNEPQTEVRIRKLQ
jgi:L-ascorbate metabolism protein UlaG (beta-lactamase superfamily)